MKIIIRFSLALLLVAGAMVPYGCQKAEGEGGRASITGKIYVKQMRPDGTVRAEFYAPEERVYIIYGDTTRVYDDDMRTDFDGRFRFRWLRAGTYTIYAFSECWLGESGCVQIGGQYPIFREVTIDRNEQVELEDIIIFDY
ncbi:MAG: carboxypeptidase regulatory-like domain-containing protein [Cryomorphaceae bacterium]|nr:MAG: carboxypeptidase regulatory-like domain-containing protein [Cryomorphaceae bacterium]